MQDAINGISMNQRYITLHMHVSMQDAINGISMNQRYITLLRPISFLLNFVLKSSY